MKTNTTHANECVPCPHCGAPNTVRYDDGSGHCLSCVNSTRESDEDELGLVLNEELGAMLVTDIVPRLRAHASSVPKIGPEDDEEIVQDSTLMAARMLVSAARKGSSVTAGNIAHYAAKAARSGRRSYYTGRSEVLSPGCQLDGSARHEWIDAAYEIEDGETTSLHDVIVPYAIHGHESDPAEEAARNLDWLDFLQRHPARHRIAITALLEGGTMRDAGKRCGLKDSAALNLRRRIAADLIEFFGEDVIRAILDGIRPAWESDLRACRDRHANRPDGMVCRELD